MHWLISLMKMHHWAVQNLEIGEAFTFQKELYVHLSHDMRSLRMWYNVRPAKAQTSLGICTV